MHYVFLMDCCVLEEAGKKILPVGLGVKIGKIAECFLCNVLLTFWCHSYLLLWSRSIKLGFEKVQQFAFQSICPYCIRLSHFWGHWLGCTRAFLTRGMNGDSHVQGTQMDFLHKDWSWLILSVGSKSEQEVCFVLSGEMRAGRRGRWNLKLKKNKMFWIKLMVCLAAKLEQILNHTSPAYKA